MNKLFILALVMAITVDAQAQAALPEPWAPPLHESAKEQGIRWLSRSDKWEIDSPPIFLREKAFLGQTISGVQKGRFITMANPGGDGKRNDFGVWCLRKFDAKQEKNIEQVFYNFLTNNSFYAPFFDPSGQRVAFRYGLPPDDTYNAFGIAIWDLKSGKIEDVRIHTPQELKQKPLPNVAYYNPLVYWSPGGRYLSYVRGGNSVGGYYDALGRPLNPYELWVTDTINHTARALVTNAGLSWAWTTKGTLLYSLISYHEETALRTRAGRPSIYEIGINDKAGKKLFDGGYFATPSPDGQWIAFADWPGKLFGQKTPTPAQEAENQAVKPGVYLFHRPTGRRIFVGELSGGAPLSLPMQWTPDSRRLYALNTQEKEGGLEGALYRMDIEQQQLTRLGTLPVQGRYQTTNISNSNWFEFRATSPEGQRLYGDAIEYTQGPSRYVNTQHTFWSIDAQTGAFTAMASLTDIANENPGWDFFDDTGINPMTSAAERFENSLTLGKKTGPQSHKPTAANLSKKRRKPKTQASKNSALKK